MTGKAVAGVCVCGKRILRTDLDGTIVTTDVQPVDAAGELRAHTAGVATYQLTHQPKSPTRMGLTARTPNDIRLHPAGLTGAHIVTAHTCKGET